ncbi:Hpt domain-containing protein [Roseateles saccharophilus]|uniref:Chemotaxis protein CheA n=1 Tax=Roseateles saccharophilus TaxID=304 RepID=A0A4R3V1X7_ROSSA|nr:Hpt domain-containing protein [Roseateles saccharophilus]MDG0833707.1 hybrid sensor histidine kinase/response regulator [Roseateles saccharophilus]TCU98786.1 chemosensory pili system protein ChpA (sensor histidine kinase/response regulator) [Roseateles saccharophilus]
MDSSLRDAELPADLSPLAWVQEELRRSLESVHKTLRRLVRDGADNRVTAFGADTQPSPPLQQAAAQLHQVSGVLSLVGLPAGASVLRAAEVAVERLAQHPLEVESGTVDIIERADFALLAYVARLLAGNKTSPLALYPSYRDLQQLNGIERIHPADLWPYEWAWRSLPLEADVAPRSPEAVRAPFEAALLRQMREPSPAHAANLSGLCAGLAAALPAGNGRTLWQLAAAVFEGQALKLLGSDAYTKRLGSKLLHELRLVGQGEQDDPQRDRLAQDLLFFCAQCRVTPGVGPRLTAVHEAYRLTDEQAGNYEDASLGRIDPAWVAQAKRRVLAAKDSWSSAAEGDQHRLASLDEQFAALAESLTRLFPSGEVLAQTLQRAVVATLRSRTTPPPALAMEVATSLLYVEAALEDAAFDQPEQADRVRRLARRVEAVAHGQPAEPLEDWMEDLYRRVSDRQTLGSVVHELRASLSEVERQCDEYFRNPTQRELLIPVPGQLQAMRGVLSVLGLDQAALATVRMRDEVDGLANTEIDFERAGAKGVFERLANNLGALGFQIDMLSVQPALAKRMFQFDESTGRLDAVMGRREGAVELPDFVASGFQADLEPEAAPAFAHEATQPLRVDLGSLELPDLSLPDVDLSQPVAAPVPAPVPPVPAPAAPAVAEPSVADDPEMREIFLEEADEVIANARAALEALRSEPADHAQLTIVRRAFHTLKGSARMVGLNDFGEGAWACEQLYNARLAEAHPHADAALAGFTAEALDYFAHWREQIAGTVPGHSLPDPLRRSADSLRLQGQPLALDWPAAEAPAEPVQPAESLAEALPVAETVEAAAPLDLGFADTQPPPVEEVVPLEPDFVLELAAPAAAASPAEPARAEPVLSLDFGATELLPDTHAPTEPLPLAPAVPHEEAPLPSLGVELDLGELPEVAEVIETPALPDDEPTLQLHVPEHEHLHAAEPVAAAEAAPLLSLVEPVAPTEPEPAPVDPDEGFKLIGPLRISIALFNIFLNEADELSRRLSIELAEWASELSHPVPASSEAHAHKLAGNAATVGYDELSALARELEHTLGRAQRAVRYEEADAELFLRAADDIRRLLHQFAAGFLKPHDPEVIERLHAYEPQEEPLTAAAPLDELSLPAAAHGFLAEEPALPAHIVAAVPEPEPEPALVPEPVSQAAAPAEPPPVAEPVALLEAAAEAEPEAGLPDNIEPDLYPIFEEEGRDLLQHLHGALREWLAEPADLGRSDACMRALHTFKGGARLAGAMRLGEQAHHLESSIEALLRAGSADFGQVEALQHEGDALEHAFEQLGRSLMAPAAAAPVAAPVPAPAVAAEPRPEPLARFATPAPVADAAAAEPSREIDWSRFTDTAEIEPGSDSLAIGQAQVRVRGSLLERMATQAGEVSIRRARMESELTQMKGALLDLDDNLERLRAQLRELDLQAEAQMHAQQELAQQGGREFDPLEFDRYTRFQELTRMLTESVGDVATLQRALGRSVQSGEDELAAQSRLTRELQDDLLRTRLVEFDSIGERMHRVVRQAGRDTGKQVRLEISGGHTELDRSVLERMSGAFEHLLRNSVSHGIETPELRTAAGKDATGTLRIEVRQHGNEVLLNFADDGAGLNLARIRERGLQLGLIAPDAEPDEAQLKRLIFAPGFSTASQITELSGRGIGMDVVRAEVGTLGGSIETASMAGEGTNFLLRLPLTTALTQIVLLKSGDQVVAVPAALMESVQRVPVDAVEAAYATGKLKHGGAELPFYWLGGLLGSHGRGHTHGKHAPVVLVRSAQAALALHVDEVIGNQEVVVKNLGAQLNRVPGLAGISLLASGDVALIYNVVALADWYGIDAQARLAAAHAQSLSAQPVAPVAEEVAQAPLVMVVDDSLTVRRVTQRLLERVGLRVMLAKDGLDAMEKLAGDELPAVVLSDIEMPRMDGFDLVRNMRADSRLAGLPVIMITSRIAQKHRDYAAQLGVEHYLGKPYDEEHLLGLIQQFTRHAARA